MAIERSLNTTTSVPFALGTRSSKASTVRMRVKTKGSAKQLEARRRRAVKLAQPREPLAENAGDVGMWFSSVNEWAGAWHEVGAAATRAVKPHPSSMPTLRNINSQSSTAARRSRNRQVSER